MRLCPWAVPALSAKKHTLSLLPCHAAAGLCSEEAPKPPIDRGLSITRYPTWSIWSIQSNLMQCIANREYTSILRLLDNLTVLSRADQMRVLGRRFSSREREQDPLPIMGQLDHYPKCALAQEIKCRLGELCDTDKRLGSELIITLSEIDANQIPTITSWLGYSLMEASAIDFIKMNDSNSDTSDLEKSQAVICNMLTELLQLFDQDQSIQRGSFTFKGRDGQVLKQIFDAIIRIDHNLPASQPVDSTTVPAASAVTGTVQNIAQFVIPSLIPPPKTTYNRSAAGASSHYRGCEQFGIDLPPGMLPLGKQHILFGFTESGDFWLKLEEHGLGNIHDIALHGRDFVVSRLFPPPEEPSYPTKKL